MSTTFIAVLHPSATVLENYECKPVLAMLKKLIAAGSCLLCVFVLTDCIFIKSGGDFNLLRAPLLSGYDTRLPNIIRVI